MDSIYLAENMYQWETLCEDGNKSLGYVNFGGISWLAKELLTSHRVRQFNVF
jgi:hypothetical protein